MQTVAALRNSTPNSSPNAFETRHQLAGNLRDDLEVLALRLR